MNDNQQPRIPNQRPLTPDELEKAGYPRDYYEQRQPVNPPAQPLPGPPAHQVAGLYSDNQPYAAFEPRAAKKKPMAWVLPVGAAVLALLIGIGIGAGNKPEPVTVPGPERVVTKEVEVPVATTPAACLEALTLNEEAFTYLSESLTHIMNQDYAAATRSTDRITPLVPKSNAAKAECRAAAQ